MRAAFLEQFPPEVPLTVVTTHAAAYVPAATTRPHLQIVALDARVADLAPIVSPYVLLDADDADGRDRLIGRIRASGARLFTLVANGAYAPSLARFVAGDAHPAAEPLVFDDIEPLFARAGWRVIDCTRIADRLAAPPEPPYQLEHDGITFVVGDAAMSERLRTAAFLVVADPA